MFKLDLFELCNIIYFKFVEDIMNVSDFMEKFKIFLMIVRESSIELDKREELYNVDNIFLFYYCRYVFIIFIICFFLLYIFWGIFFM